MRELSDYEAMAAQLEATGDYRILRRLQPRTIITPPDGSETKLGLFIDLETTGLDPVQDEIIEMAMVPFVYALDGRIFEIKEAFCRLRQPSIPIPAEVTALTGITDEMVAGKSIDPAEVAAFAAPAAIVIAHNAAFDRRFAERYCDVFTTKPWACSMGQIDWATEGFAGTKLGYLLAGCGLFHGAHRASDDCLAAIEIPSPSTPGVWGSCHGQIARGGQGQNLQDLGRKFAIRLEGCTEGPRVSLEPGQRRQAQGVVAGRAGDRPCC